MKIETPVSSHLQAVANASRPFVEFLTRSAWAQRRGESDICDFVVGNPHDAPLPSFVGVLRGAADPKTPDWFGYKLNERSACQAVARGLKQRLGVQFEADDIFLTKGASTAIAIALSTFVSPGEEVVFFSPPWFFYEPMISFVRAVPVRAAVDPNSFDLDLGALSAAITSKTRAVIINSPNNPTGKVYSPDVLRRLGRLLEAASAKYGKAIYLLSDESYSRIIFDGRSFATPTAFYPYSLLIYSYAKALLTPGERLGYLALSSNMPNRDSLRMSLFITQCSGFGFPDAVLQHALPELEGICIDVNELQQRRDTLFNALTEFGYSMHRPEGAWYLLPRCPIKDDKLFVQWLAEEDIFVMPGSIVELPGFFRISLTATPKMIADSLRGFQSSLRRVREFKSSAELVGV